MEILAQRSTTAEVSSAVQRAVGAMTITDALDVVRTG
jgi:hypothetical protein